MARPLDLNPDDAEGEQQQQQRSAATVSRVAAGSSVRAGGQGGSLGSGVGVGVGSNNYSYGGGSGSRSNNSSRVAVVPAAVSAAGAGAGPGSALYAVSVGSAASASSSGSGLAMMVTSPGVTRSSVGAAPALATARRRNSETAGRQSPRSLSAEFRLTQEKAWLAEDLPENCHAEVMRGSDFMWSFRVSGLHASLYQVCVWVLHTKYNTNNNYYNTN